MNILLMTPPWYRLQEASLSHYPPGPTYIAGALEKIGYDAIVWNADYDPRIRPVVGGTNILDTDELTKKHNLYVENLNNLEKAIWKEIADKLRLFNPNVLGISAYSATYKACLNVASIAKRLNPDVITIFGGVHPSIDPEGVARKEVVDFVVSGEGEITAQELIKAIDNGENDFSRINGLAYKNNGKIIVNRKRELVDNLDDIVSVARHKIYQKELCPPGVFNMVYSSRGCPFKCIYCGSFNIWGRKKRSRGAESLLDEIEKTHKDYGTRYFYICDDIFFHPTDMERAYEFCEGLIERKLRILWSTQTRAETINEDNEEILKLMKRTGGQHIAIGVETGSDRISKLIKKGNRIEHARKAAELIRKHGLYMVSFFMFGFPWETEEEIQQTIDFMKEIDPPIVFPHIVTPAPGTGLNKIALDMGLITPDFPTENFYHASPEMCLSIEIPQEKRRAIIYRTLRIFTEHNKRHFRRDLIRRWYFYYSLMHDNGVFKEPHLLIQYIKDAFSRNGERKMYRNIAGKNVVITGASSGIGRSCAFSFAENGANVALVSKHGERERLEQIKEELNKSFPDVEVFVRPTDVSKQDDVGNMVKDVVENFKRVDILVNCAGVGMHGPIVETKAENLHKLMAVNFYGYFYCIKEIHPYMKQNGGGQIINICSLVGHKAFPGMGIYAASKHAVKGLSDALRVELEKDNISVILVSPSDVDTEFRKNSFIEGKEEYIYDKKGCPPDYIAKEIVKAAATNKREVVLSRKGKIITALNRLSPVLTDMLIKFTRKKAET